MPGALEGIRIIDITTVILGPWAAQQLGDMGVEIIKVETPTGDLTRAAGARRNVGIASFFMGANRNKRSIVLDLTKPRGHEVLFKLVARHAIPSHQYDFPKAHPPYTVCSPDWVSTAPKCWRRRATRMPT